MRDREDDISYLLDIYHMAKDILIATKTKYYARFIKSKWKLLSTERLLERIGQASKKISKATRDELPNIPWKSMIGLRNILAHDYDEVLYIKLWNISKNDIPVLIKELEKIKELKDYINNGID